MTRDEIIRVARGAGLLRMTPIPGDSEFVADLERFAAIIEQRAQARTLAEPGELHRIVISWTDAGMTLNGQPVNPGILRLENSGAQYESAVKVDVEQ